MEQKMASCDKVLITAAEDDEDEDLEALRLAALQTLRANKPPVAVTTNKVPIPHRAPGRGAYRGGMSRGRLGRNNVFQRHRVNSNLIAIVPVSEEPAVENSVTEKKTTGHTFNSDSSAKLILPQDRYCKSTNSEILNEEHTVTSKFSRYEDSNSDSSAEESDDGESSSGRTSVGENEVAAAEEPENDPDVLVMGAEDEEDSLEKLMDELEEEINKTETDVPANSTKNTSQKASVNRVNPISENTQKVKKDTEKSSKNKRVSANSEKSKSKVPVKTNTLTAENKILRGVNPVQQKSVHTIENASHKQSSKPCKEPIHESFSKYVSRDISPKRRLSPINSRRSRSRSRSPPPKRSRSRSPRARYYSPPLRLPHSPRGRSSRSPIRSPRRSRSRTPVKSYRSSKEKCSRTPPWYPPTNHHLSRLSPRRSPSPNARREFSPRRSISPRSNHISPIRSPGQSRWPLSPRRSPRRRSLSPPFTRQPRSRSRRISPSPPRRPVSSLRRRLSPSPIRRNPSPPRKYSPLRRNPSPRSSRYSRSLSRSPVPRSRSPVNNRSLHPISPPPPLSPRRRLSSSPRRHASHSPYNRLPPKRISPASQNLSPWSPPRQTASRYSPAPAPKQRSSSPYTRQRRRSNSAGREVHRNRPPRRISHSPPLKDLRKPLQESRIANMTARSRSPPAVARVIPSARSRHGTRSPRQSVSPPRRSLSRLSSLSLSPSPERTAVSDSHRYKSPLRVTDYRNVPVSAPKESKSVLRHGSRERKAIKPRNRPSPIPSNAKVCPKARPSKRKDSRNKLPKKNTKEDIKTDSTNRSQEKCDAEKYTTDAAGAKQNNEVNAEVLSILEARKRKFETVEPVKPVAKKIYLKAVKSELREEKDQQQPAKEKEAASAKTSDSESRLLEGSEDDFYDLDDHEPFPELDFLSSDESDVEKESRFKSSDQKILVGNGSTATIPFSRILDRSPAHEEKTMQSKKVLDGAKVKDSVEKELSDKNYTLQAQEFKDSDDAWEKHNVGGLLQGNKQLENFSKGMGGDEQNNQKEAQDDKEEVVKSSKEGDLRTELSRRRAERLTKAGSLHEKLPARLLQSAFEGVVGKKNAKHAEREEKHLSSKQGESKKEKSEVRRVQVLKRPPAERRVASISVTIPKESKRDVSPPAKLPIHMRLGLPAIGAGSPPEERLSSRRRNRKPKLKRNVMLGNNKEELRENHSIFTQTCRHIFSCIASSTASCLRVAKPVPLYANHPVAVCYRTEL